MKYSLLACAATAWAGTVSVGIEHKLSSGRIGAGNKLFHDLAVEHSSGPSAFVESLADGFYLYYATLYIGSNRQKVVPQLDTGSSDLWVMTNKNPYCVGNDECTGMVFDPETSTTFKNTSTPWDISYMDTTGAFGFLAQDTVEVDGTSVPNAYVAVADIANSTEDVFGVGFQAGEATVVYHRDEPSNVYPNYPVSLKEQGFINTVAYSLYLNDLNTQSGNILFGGVDHAKYTGTLGVVPIVNPYSSINYNIALNVMLHGISVSSANASCPLFKEIAYPVLLDSGTSYAALPNATIAAMASAYGYHWNQTDGFFEGDCNVFDFDGFDLNFSGIHLHVPAQSLLAPSENNNTESPCLLAIQGEEELSNFILGDVFMRNFYIVYDLENNQIALAQARYTDESDIEEIVSSIPSATTAPLYNSTAFITDIVTLDAGVCERHTTTASSVSYFTDDVGLQSSLYYSSSTTPSASSSASASATANSTSAASSTAYNNSTVSSATTTAAPFTTSSSSAVLTSSPSSSNTTTSSVVSQSSNSTSAPLSTTISTITSAPISSSSNSTSSSTVPVISSSVASNASSTLTAVTSSSVSSNTTESVVASTHSATTSSLSSSVASNTTSSAPVSSALSSITANSTSAVATSSPASALSTTSHGPANSTTGGSTTTSTPIATSANSTASSPSASTSAVNQTMSAEHTTSTVTYGTTLVISANGTSTLISPSATSSKSTVASNASVSTATTATPISSAGASSASTSGIVTSANLTTSSAASASSETVTVPTPTTLTTAGQTFTVTGSTVLTITDCGCTKSHDSGISTALQTTERTPTDSAQIAYTTTEVVSTFITSCSEPTTFSTNGQTYTVTDKTVLTITDCPCTLTHTLSSTPSAAAVASSASTSTQSSSVANSAAASTSTQSASIANSAAASTSTKSASASVNSVSTGSAQPVYTTTEVVSTFITSCSEPTTFSTNGQTYTVTDKTVLTITDCPCTLTHTRSLSSSSTPSTTGTQSTEATEISLTTSASVSASTKASISGTVSEYSVTPSESTVAVTASAVSSNNAGTTSSSSSVFSPSSSVTHSVSSSPVVSSTQSVEPPSAQPSVAAVSSSVSVGASSAPVVNFAPRNTLSGIVAAGAAAICGLILF